MGDSRKAPSAAGPRLTAAILFLCTALSTGWAFLVFPDGALLSRSGTLPTPPEVKIHLAFTRLKIASVVLAVGAGFGSLLRSPATAELRILRVTKRGLRFQETRVISFRDGMAWVTRNDRSQLEDRFAVHAAWTALAETSPVALEHRSKTRGIRPVS
jgi:hypothetical protein